MRYTRLRRQIEGGTLIGTHGTPFIRGAKRIAEVRKKSKKPMANEYDEGRLRAVQKETAPRYQKKDVKFEQSESSDGWETSSSENVDSEDEMPLAKRMLHRSSCFASANCIEAAAGHQQFSEIRSFSELRHEIYPSLGARQLHCYQPISPLHDTLSKAPVGIQQKPLFSPEKEVATQFDTRSAWDPDPQSLETSPSAMIHHSTATDKAIHGGMLND
jgi:hypothetical protein